MNTYVKTIGTISSSVFNGFNYNNGLNPNIQVGFGNAEAGMLHRVYEYEANGVKYSRAETPMVSPDIVKKTLGMQVDVYYNPSNPKESFISVPNKTDIYKILAIVFLSISISLIVIGLLCLLFIPIM